MTKLKLLLPLLLFLCVTQITHTFENEADLRKIAQETFPTSLFTVISYSVFQCPMCDATASTEEGIKKHLQRAHKEIKPSEVECTNVKRFVVRFKNTGKHWLPGLSLKIKKHNTPESAIRYYNTWRTQNPQTEPQISLTKPQDNSLSNHQKLARKRPLEDNTKDSFYRNTKRQRLLNPDSLETQIEKVMQEAVEGLQKVAPTEATIFDFMEES